jgi:hypothetical protein
MSHTDTLRMPEHRVPDQEPQPDGADLYSHDEGILCRAGRVAGYAHMLPDGRLHCNRCGWVTPESVITAYSPDTDSTYLTWEDLVAAEALGWVVVGTSDRPNTVPVVVGLFDTQADARRARVRLRRRWQREENEKNVGTHTISTVVRPLWKENRK